MIIFTLEYYLRCRAFSHTCRIFQRALEIKRLKQQNQELARERENNARMQGKNASDHERAVAERKVKQQNDLQVSCHGLTRLPERSRVGKTPTKASRPNLLEKEQDAANKSDEHSELIQ